MNEFQNRKVKVAFIGAGAIANSCHYPSLTSFPDVEIAAVCDLVADKAQQTAERWSIPQTFTDYRQMLEEVKPDAVYVIMPPQHLYEPAKAVLEQGRHLFVEKPLALTTLQARMLAYLADQHNCLTAVGFQRRHIPALTDFRRRVEERGAIHHVAVSFYKTTANVEVPAGHYGGIIDSLWVDGVHAVDSLRWLCGGEVETLCSAVRTRNVPGPVPNEFNALVTFSSGATGILQYSFMTGRRLFRTEFHGHCATATVDADSESTLALDGKVVESRPSSEWGTTGGAPGTESLHWQGFWHENRDFINCIKGGRQPSTHFNDAVKTMELVERIVQHSL